MAYSKPEACSELWYTQNFGTFRTKDIFRIVAVQNSEVFRTGDILRNLSNIYDEAF